MKTGAVVLLLLVGLSMGSARLWFGGKSDTDNTQYGQQIPKPFGAGQEYTFSYDTQAAAGLLAQTDVSDSAPQQKAVSRIQTIVKIHFGSESQATLSMGKVRFGQLNEEIPEPHKVKPMGMFEPKQMPEEKQRTLQLPVQFTYNDGVIVRVQFHEDDEIWSKNIKRSVLNMIQLNLKRNNAQGLRQTDITNDQLLNEQDLSDNQGTMSKAFTLPEITLEGACLTTYSINKAQQQQQQQDDDDESNQGRQFNVTKSIDFKQCSKISDVANGFQTQQPQPQQVQCQVQQWFRQQQQNQPEQQLRQQQGPCSKFDPKEIKEQKLDRSTIIRHVLVGTQQKYAIKRAEVVSQYVYKSMYAENGQHSSAMQTIVSSELVFRGVQSKSQSSQKLRDLNENSETLLYDNKMEVEEKRYYMYGDEQFSQKSPFQNVPNKVDQTEKVLRKLIQLVSDKNNGIEVDAPIQLQKLVNLLRMLSVNDLKQVERSIKSSSSGQSLSQSAQQKAEMIFADALAIAGTRNTIVLLTQKILNKDLTEIKAAQALKALTGLPAPSDSQIKSVLHLCESELVHRSAPLRQTCWLTFGAITNELCQHKTQKSAQQSVFGAQSGFNTEEVCPLDKKQKYKEALLKQFKSAETTYDRVLGLKALGNAGIDISVNDLEQIITAKRENRLVRAQAIDALRRLRVQMPRKIQNVLLPIFQNTREHPELRMAAFAMIMNTLPQQQIVDQLAFVLSKESSQQVKSFVYKSMRVMANSQNPIEQEIAKHIKNALKLTYIDEQTLRYSGKYQLPLYSEQQQEGVFVNLMAAFSKRNMVPAYLSANLDTMLNGEFDKDLVRMSFTQKDIEQWVEEISDKALSLATNGHAPTRGQRNQRSNSEQLRQFYKTLGIKSRRSSSIRTDGSSDIAEPFGMVTLRIKDVDCVMLPIEPKLAPRFLRQILNGEKPSLRSVSWDLVDGRNFQLAIATNLDEKFATIPTSMGVPLRVHQSMPILATIDGNVKIGSDSEGLNSPLAIKAQISVHPNVNIAHLQKMEIWMPTLACGVESLRAAELNLPIQGDITASTSQGIQMRIKTPQASKTRVIGLHSLPTTYCADYNTRAQILREPHVKAVHNTQLERLQHEIDRVYGQQNGLQMPFRVHGHYHWPARALDYQQFMQLCMATENAIHVTFEPTTNTPREIIVRLDSKIFQKITGSDTSSHNPDLGRFYSTNSAKFEAVYPEDLEDMELENVNTRRQKLDSFVSKFQPERVYKHMLKASIHTVGGQNNYRAEIEVEGSCDPQIQYCKLFINGKKNAGRDESGEWKLTTRAEILFPESVSRVQEIENSGKHQKFVCHVNAQWGADNKQSVEVRVQGEQAQNKQIRSIDSSDEASRRYFKKHTSFLNKFDMEADYKLKPQMQNLFNRALESLKSYNFWNTQSDLLESRRDGKLRVTVVIDPITQKHANISVQTPGQKVRMQSIELPTKIRPFPLIRQNAKPVHSAIQLFSNLATQSRAECQVDGRRVDSFDDAQYESPMSHKCYSVLAKDCSVDEDEEPRFVILMKKLQKQGQEKKIKIITPEQTVEIQPKEDQDKLIVKINGKTISNNNEAEDDQQQIGVHFNDYQKTDVTVTLPCGVVVRFNGRKAWIKMSQLHKYGQCGLCGHYDGQSQNEWRKSDNEETDDMSSFHRSYSLKDTECTDDEQDNFYEENKNIFEKESRRQKRRQQQQQQQDDSDEDDSQNQDRDNQDQQEDSQEQDRRQSSSWEEEDDQDFDGEYNSNKRNNPSSWQQWLPYRSSAQRQSRRGGSIEEPIEKTKVIEFSHKVCFSTRPVKECPKGTYATGSQDDSDYGNDEENDSTNRVSVPFACVQRSSAEARRLLHKVKCGEQVEMNESRASSFIEKLKEPTKCVAY
jgi:hypothetical protein